MALRAIAFDYGMVLSGPPEVSARSKLLEITGLSPTELERYYWIDRHAYDRGDLTGLGFWRKLVADAGLTLPDSAIEELNTWDARMWTTENPHTLSWHKALKQQGFRTGILSNMGDTVLQSIQATFNWIHDFDVRIWSYQHNLAKPEAAIYHLLLDQLGTAARETLFLDDKEENIHAARVLGMQAIQFSTVEQLRRDLQLAGLDKEIPLP